MQISSSVDNIQELFVGADFLEVEHNKNILLYIFKQNKLFVEIQLWYYCK